MIFYIILGVIGVILAHSYTAATFFVALTAAILTITVLLIKTKKGGGVPNATGLYLTFFVVCLLIMVLSGLNWLTGNIAVTMG